MSPAREPSTAYRRALARRLYLDDGRLRPDWLDLQLLRAGQVALLFQVSRRTVSDWARAGLLPAIITPGGHRRFRARDVRRLVESLRADVRARPPGRA
ncbi:MAG: helix-turn-helix domain-containing protein [Acidobacteria bacterium]|nr:helix-turn-helix domain-containing protein [Acidobacteriota bacterium]